MVTHDLLNKEAGAKAHDSEVDKEEARMANLGKNGVPTHGQWVEKFRRDKAGAATDEYEGLNTGEQKILRKQWMDEQLKQYRVEKRYDKCCQQIDENKGEYMAFPALVQACGGMESKENIVAAGKHASKCILLGGKWASKNHTGERWECLRMRRFYRELFSESWSLFDEEISDKKRFTQWRRCRKDSWPRR